MASLQSTSITGSLYNSGSVTIEGSGSTVFDVQGSQGQLFSITDNLSGSLFSVNDISGIPILEVFSDETVKLGTFGDEAIIVNGNTASITGSLEGTSSYSDNSDLLDGQEGSYYRNASNLDAGTISDARLPSSITSDITGNAATATKWATARTITLGGDLSGNVSIDGSANVTLTAAVADDSHTHDGRYYTETESDSRFVNVTGDTMTGDLNIGNGTTNSRVTIDKANNAVSDHLIFEVAGVRIGEIGGEDSTWLRINQETAKNIYTPRSFRSDGYVAIQDGLVVGGTTLGPHNPNGIEIQSTDNEKIVLSGATSPYIRFQESTTDKAYVQWNSAGYLYLRNQEDSSGLRIKDQIDFSVDGLTFNRVFHDGYHPNADTWTTSRTITIGGTGKTVNGSANVTWTTSEIGINDSTITISAGTALSTGGNFTTNQGTNETITINHSPLFRTDATDSATLSFGGTFDAISNVGTTTEGHVSGSTNKTFTLPSLPSDNVTGTGASGQVAYFTGANTIDSESNLYWDSTNDRLGIGTSSPQEVLDVNVGATENIRFGTYTNTGFIPALSFNNDFSSGGMTGFAAGGIVNSMYLLGDSFEMFTGAAGRSRAFAVSSGGRIGMGAFGSVGAIDAHVHIKQSANSDTGGIRLEDASSTSVWWNIYNDGGDELQIKNQSGNGGYLDSATNVSNIDFTGQHRSLTSLDFDSGSIEDLTGLIVVADGTYANFDGSTKASVNEALPNVKLSETENDKKAFGVISDTEDLKDGRKYAMGNWVSVYTSSLEEQPRLVINSVGEGGIWVCNYSGSFENGDYITTSPIKGLGMNQNSPFLMNYTVGKITQDCDFSDSSEYIEFEYSGSIYRKQFVGCTYHCG